MAILLAYVIFQKNTKILPTDGIINTFTLPQYTSVLYLLDHVRTRLGFAR